jgi:hypothetical protein
MLCVVIALLKAWHLFRKYTRYEWPLLNVRHGLNGNYKKEVVYCSYSGGSPKVQNNQREKVLMLFFSISINHLKYFQSLRKKHLC